MREVVFRATANCGQVEMSAAIYEASAHQIQIKIGACCCLDSGSIQSGFTFYTADADSLKAMAEMLDKAANAIRYAEKYQAKAA